MKKLIVLPLVFALTASVVFAETYFGAWGRAVFIPLFYDGNAAEGEELQAMTQVGWDPYPNMAFYFSISGEQIGFVANWDFAASDMWNAQGRDGEIKAWWQPNDWFRMDFGWARDDRMRGVDTVDSMHFLSGGMYDMNDFVFHRLSTGEWYQGDYRPGAIFALTPVEGLYVGMAIATGPAAFPGWSGLSPRANLFEDVYKSSQYVLGYTIDGIGRVRAGYHGLSSTLPQLIQFAFELTAVDGLTLDLGVGYSISKEVADAKANNMTVGLVTGYRTDMFSIDLNVGAFLGGDKDAVAIPAHQAVDDEGELEFEEDGVTPVMVPAVMGEAGVLKLMLTPAVTLDFGTIGLNFILGTDFSGGDNVMNIGGGLWFAKNFGGGSVKAGVMVDLPAGKDMKPVISVPIELTYSVW